jgi:hypothetical protein
MTEINKERPKMKFAADIVKKTIQQQDGHAQSQAQTHYLKNHVKNLVEIEKTEYRFIRMLKKLLLVTKNDIVGFNDESNVEEVPQQPEKDTKKKKVLTENEKKEEERRQIKRSFEWKNFTILVACAHYRTTNEASWSTAPSSRSS